ncbi:hypothetical protein SERLA73DRAFT_151007 [Serpula lacrymans var. lacrymans S7.3]|uniref:CAF17 C-terminal domain-containing protein n=1 Tax=Serpula lacrymans var. lacrymans (strain S7.3) TaxID=936435 RepID=F8PP96_SERL3|nr:hypothetical protein SERLA73DRAFT_151007 [Serpula lacrymans var. lacrymans S7.3]
MPVPPALRNLIRTTPTLAPLNNKSIISVSGSQATEFLNGLLATSGRVLHDVFLYTQPAPLGKSAFLIEHDSSPSETPQLVTLLKRYVLRSKVKIRDVSEEYDVWAAWGSEAGDKVAKQFNWAPSGSAEPVLDLEAGKWPWGLDHGVIRDWRAVGMGRRMLVAKEDRPKEASTHDLTSSDAYLLHRIMHGVPEGSTDIQPMHAFPMESNLDLMGGLDFRKGCYVGQELTVRTYHKGVVRKRILPVTISGNEKHSTPSVNSPPPSLPVHLSVFPTRRDGERPPRGTGTLLSTILAPAHGISIGLALLRLEHVEGAQKGDIDLAVKSTQGDDASGEKTWQVQHWCPDWWPNQESA